jgi:hypothetical protein
MSKFGDAIRDIRLFNYKIDFPWWLAVAIIVFTIIILSTYFGLSRDLETQTTVLQRKNALMTAWNVGDIITESSKEATKRKSFTEFQTYFNSTLTNQNQQVLANMQFMTANATGFFFPNDPANYKNGVFAVDAVRYAAKAGARAFVFDIWPSMFKKDKFAPVLQVNTPGSPWRIESMNVITFESVLRPLVQEIYEPVSGTLNPYKDDIVVFYLRFRGDPRPETYDKTASALKKHIDQYRLPFQYSSNAKRLELPSTNPSDLKGSIIIATNKYMKDESPTLYEYINTGPTSSSDTIPIEYTPENIGVAVSDTVKSTFSFALQNPEDPTAGSNGWTDGINKANMLGVSCIAMNVFNNDQYRSTMFNTTNSGITKRYSYKIREAGTRFTKS